LPSCLFSVQTCSSAPSYCGNFNCEEDEAGLITVSYHSCYGSPPARLERFARAQHAALRYRRYRSGSISKRLHQR
jgi:hypothetical protein